MDQDPATPPPPAASDGKSKIFGNINNVIAGITGLVVALGGLAAATRGVVWDKEPAKESAAAAPAAPAAPAAAADTATDPEPGDPTAYEGDGVTIEWTGDEWLLTDSEGEYHYEDMYSPDETRVLGYDKTNSAYLRWPLKGGMSEQGSSDKQTWTNYVELYPAEESSE